MRKCGNCYKDLPSALFRENLRSRDGLHPNCISCQDGITGMAVIPKARYKAALEKPQARGRVDNKKLPWTAMPKRNRK